jgi:acyl-CoA synthetase (AMP-forming)/AMP-acid ligase II
LTRWSEIYGCTELGGIGAREGLEREYRLFPWWGDQLAGEEAPDELDWADGRHFLLGGRKDGRVEVSGMQVDLSQVRRALLECPGVQAVALRKGRERIEALVAGRVAREAIEGWAAERLERWERPRILRVENRIRVDERGKPLFDLKAGVDV